MLVNEGLLTEAQLRAILSSWLGTLMVDPCVLPPDPAAIAVAPRKHAQREGLLPLLLRDGTLVVLFASPWDRRQMDELRFVSQKTILPLLAAPGTLQPAQDKAYTGYTERMFNPTKSELHEREGAVTKLSAAQLVGDLEQAGQVVDAPEWDVVSESDSAMVRLINSIIEEAVAKRASDIHIESDDEQPKPMKIRLRIDGELRVYLELDARFRFALVGWLKIMASLDISEHRRPQDGKIDFARFGHVAVELRMVTVPTAQGREDVVLRILSAGTALPLNGIGLSPAHLTVLREVVHRPYGLILICGPTGCGKTTTLHSVMSDINSVGRKIWTAEDPIEITHPGLRQVQVNTRIGWTFAAAMRTFLRADPDVIIIGELRDEETARIAVEASLTGHLVLSKLHTNSAPESVPGYWKSGSTRSTFRIRCWACWPSGWCVGCARNAVSPARSLLTSWHIWLGYTADMNRLIGSPLMNSRRRSGDGSRPRWLPWRSSPVTRSCCTARWGARLAIRPASRGEWVFTS